MKLTVIGGGGTRALILAKSLLLQADELALNEIVFMDNNPEKLAVFAGMAAQAAKRLNPNVRFSITSSAKEAVTSADYVITTLRVGGDEARARDERIAIRHGLIGQETTGAGGFGMATRSIPALIEYCKQIRELASPGVLVFNFTNPAGLVTQALRDLGYDFVYGICDAPSGLLRQVCVLTGGSVKMDVFGLNHLSYFGNFRMDGRDITNELINNPLLYSETDMRYFEPELAKRFGLLFNEYLYYFYYREKAEENLCRVTKTRGEQIAELNAQMQDILKNCVPERDFDRMLRVYSDFNHRRELSYMAAETSVSRNADAAPIYDLYSPEEGGYAGVALALVRAKQLGTVGRMTLCVPNAGTVPWLLDSDIVECTCAISADGAAPLPMALDLPESAVNLIRTVKLYERLAVKAVLENDKKIAAEALMVHPLVNSYSLAKALADEYMGG